MEYRDEKGLSERAPFFVTMVSVAFIALIWRYIPIQVYFKMALLCFAGAWIWIVISDLFERIPYFIPNAHSQKRMIIVCIAFLLFPCLINAIYEVGKYECLTARTPDATIGLQITYDVDRIGGSGSVGSEWSYHHYFNDVEFDFGDTVEIRASDPFVIRSRFVESDAISDIGESVSKPIVICQEHQENRQFIIENNVLVKEIGGRKYAGSYAEFTATYYAKLVMPPSLSFWDVYLQTCGDLVGWLLIIGQVTCLFIVAYIIVEGTHRKEKAKAQERLAQERKKQEERELFIKSLGGKTIREVAGVPEHVTYEGDLPKDNNNQRFGSFTVYITQRGACFHRTQGCCAARFPIHIFVAKKRYRPCTKCCTVAYSIPDWHNKYTELKNKCIEHSVEYEQ